MRARRDTEPQGDEQSWQPVPDPAVLAAYLAPWQAAYPGIDLDRATSLALLGDRVLQAISYDAI